MERPQTRRGSAADPWDQSSDYPTSTSKVSSNNHTVESGNLTTTRPFSRMASEYSVHKSPRTATPMRPIISTEMAELTGPAAGIGAVNRLITTAGRPGSRSVHTALTGTTGVRLLSTHQATSERPTTQQGLGGLKTGFRGPQRQVQDKSYFLGLLRTKMNELNSEIAKLAKGIDKNDKEQQNLPALENKVKEMAIEITELQKQAADLNLLQEKIATSSDPIKMEVEYKEFVNQNEKGVREVEAIFDKVKTSKEKINLLEKEIQQEQDSVNQFIATLPAEEQRKYAELREESEHLEKQVDNITGQTAALENRNKQLQEELNQFPVKEEFYRLHLTVAELEKKHKLMLEQEANRLNPDEERAQLLANVRSDNAQIAAMEQQIKEFQTQVERVQNELKRVEESFEENQSDRAQKYRDLRKREEAMDEFLATWHENCNAEKGLLDDLEKRIHQTLIHLGRNQSLMNFVPSMSEFSNAKENLMLKEGELEKSRTTLEGVAFEYQRLSNNLQKLEELESKIDEELAVLKENLTSMQDDLVKFGGVEELRRSTEHKRNQLILEQQNLVEKRGQLQTIVDQLQTKHDELQDELNHNETHLTLKTLEEKLSLIEKENESIRAFLSQHQTSHNLSLRRQDAMVHVNNYIKSLKSSIGQI